MTRLRMRGTGATRDSAPQGERYEVCQVVRNRFGARVLRVLATADDEEGADLAVRTIAGEQGPDIGPILIVDTATRLWLSRDRARGRSRRR